MDCVLISTTKLLTISWFENLPAPTIFLLENSSEALISLTCFFFPNFEYEINFEHDYCKEYVIRDSDCLSYSLQLFACDLIEGQNKLEITSEYIMPILFILDLQKNKSYNPVSLNKKIDNALELISISKTDATNLVLINNLKILQKLVLVCIDYEVDIKCTIEART